MNPLILKDEPAIEIKRNIKYLKLRDLFQY